MKVKDILDVRGIKYKELKEDRDRFTVLFEAPDHWAIKALTKSDYAITSESETDKGWKVSGVKKKDLKTASDNPLTDIHATDPARLRAEILKDIK